MPFSVKDWVNGQILDATGLEDLETRVTNYAAIEAVNTVAASGTTETLPDPTTQSISVVTLTGNCVFTFPTATIGTSFTLILKQDGTGSRTVTWPATVKWASGTDPVLSTPASSIDIFSFVCAETNVWYGFTAGKAMA